MIKRINKPTIELKNIIIDYNKSVNDSNAEDYISKIGIYPFVIFNGLILDYKYFIDFKLQNDEFLPKLEMKFRDITNKMIDALFPLDDSIISVFIKSPSEYLQPVRMDFKVTYFNPIKNTQNKDEITYHLMGILDVSPLYYTIFSSYRGTSFDVLKKISEELGLGFATNIQNTNDNQKWLNPADTKVDFIQNIVMASYKSDESFLLSYIDFYYNLNYIDVESQFQDETDNLQGIDDNSIMLKKNGDNMSTLILTNHPDAYTTSNYITKYNILNESTNVNLNIGYFGAVKYYKKIEREISVFTVDALSNTTDQDLIVLKSNSDTSNDNLNNFGGKHIFYGTIDTDNMHENYHYAIMQNARNINFFQKVRMKIVINQPNFNLYRFQMIKVKLYKMQEIDAKIRTNRNSTLNDVAYKNIYEDKLNKRLSGDWMVIGINYRFHPDIGWEQEVNLIKRELNTSEI